MKIRTVVIDDEPLARSRIVNRLSEQEEIVIIGECRNGKEAISFITKKRPDLIFLDIQMPDMDGFAVLGKLKLDYDPFIIFATAYDQYALKAFEVHAIDYLLKPFDNERFNEALSRAKEQIKLKKTAGFNHKLMSLMREFQQAENEFLSAFEIKKNGRQIKVFTEDIIWIEADGNYLNLNTERGSYLYRATMNAIESELNPQQFLRIHRSFIVNRRFIAEVNYLNTNEYRFKLKNGNELVSGRSYKGKIGEYLAEAQY